MSQTASAGPMCHPCAEAWCSLGESPTWDAESETAQWVDATRGRLYESRVLNGVPQAPREMLRLDGALPSAAPAEGGGYLLAQERHLIHVGADLREIARREVIPAGTGHRLNDGACDPAGRFVVGSIGPTWDGTQERLWRLEHDGTFTVIGEGITASNGIAWSPDGTRMYHADTFAHVVTSRSYDASSAEVGAPHVLVDLGDALPDGISVDADGALWVACWGAGEVRRYSAAGEPLGRITTGAPFMTNCAFVGRDLDRLLITTAVGLARTDEPPTTGLAGRVLWCEPGVHGVRGAPWRPVPW